MLYNFLHLIALTSHILVIVTSKSTYYVLHAPYLTQPSAYLDPVSVISEMSKIRGIKCLKHWFKCCCIR